MKIKKVNKCKSMVILSVLFAVLILSSCEDEVSKEVEASIVKNQKAIISNPPSGKINVAIGADTSESSTGWGGGSYPVDIVDGNVAYSDTWAHGLAFTGGPKEWAGDPCGERQAVVDFGQPMAVDQARVWHHGPYSDHLPTVYRLDYWDGLTWQPTSGVSSVRWDLDSTTNDAWGAVPTEHIFTEVTTEKVRFVLDNCPMTGDGHGWIYEFEVFSSLDKPDMEAVSGTFKYKVFEDSARNSNGETPINTHFYISAEIQNVGDADSGEFTIGFYLSDDENIDPKIDQKLTLHTPTGNIVECTIDNLVPGAGRVIGYAIDLSRISIPIDKYNGNNWIGMVVDSQEQVDESNEDNNLNMGYDIDLKEVTLYDPILRGELDYRPLTDENGAAITFRNRGEASRYLLEQGFTRPMPTRNIYVDAGWSLALEGQPIKSYFNGQDMPAEAFRIQAMIPRNCRNCTINIQGEYEYNSEDILPTKGEPSPVWAQHHLNPDWLLYVMNYHRRF